MTAGSSKFVYACLDGTALGIIKFDVTTAATVGKPNSYVSLKDGVTMKSVVCSDIFYETTNQMVYALIQDMINK